MVVVEEDVGKMTRKTGRAKNENENHDCRFSYSFGWKQLRACTRATC
jgi:hypothetical protein